MSPISLTTSFAGVSHLNNMENMLMTLAEHIRQNLLKDTTLANLCRLRDLSYEGCKKSLAKNTFSQTQLDILFPGVGIDQLQKEYTFRVARIYQARLVKDTAERKAKASQLGHLLDLIDSEDVRLIGENQLVAEKIAELIRSKCAQIREALN